MADPERQLERLEEYVRRLDRLEAAVDRNTAAVLEGALEAILRDLRRAYNAYLSATRPNLPGSDGVERMPGSYTTAESATRFRSLLQIAEQFLPPADVEAWGQRFADDLAAATNLGGEAAAGLHAIATQAAAAVPFAGANTQAINASVRVASAFIEGEGARFRQQIVQIVGEGVAKGHGSKRLERDIRRALEGSGDPSGTTARVGLKRRAQLIARTELANAYGQGQIDHAKAEGFTYVRSIATEDERTCPQCMSRHGQIFRADRIPPAWHPMCRCSYSPVIDEAVDEPDPTMRDELLDNAFWRDQREAGVKAYAKGKGITIEQAEKELARALRTPTPSERFLRPDDKKPLAPSVALDAPAGGRTFEEAVLERNARRGET